MTKKDTITATSRQAQLAAEAAGKKRFAEYLCTLTPTERIKIERLCEEWRSVDKTVNT